MTKQKSAPQQTRTKVPNQQMPKHIKTMLASIVDKQQRGVFKRAMLHAMQVEEEHKKKKHTKDDSN